MGALTEKRKRDTIFLVVKDFSLCEEGKSEREGFQAVERKNPRTGATVTKYVRYFDNVEGFVSKIEWYDTAKQYDTRYCGYKIHIAAGDQPVVLDLPTKTRAYDVLMKVAENVDWEQEVMFSAWHDRREDTTAFVVRQNGQVIRHAYTKEHPGKCPPPQKTIDETGEEKWDFREQRLWLKRRFDEVIIPAITAAQAKRATPAKPRPADELDAALQYANRKAAAATANGGGYPPDDYPPVDDYPLDDEVPF